jgi:hypothetical protein
MACSLDQVVRTNFGVIDHVGAVPGVAALTRPVAATRKRIRVDPSSILLLGRRP